MFDNSLRQVSSTTRGCYGRGAFEEGGEHAIVSEYASREAMRRGPEQPKRRPSTASRGASIGWLLLVACGGKEGPSSSVPAWPSGGNASVAGAMAGGATLATTKSSTAPGPGGTASATTVFASGSGSTGMSGSVAKGGTPHGHPIAGNGGTGSIGSGGGGLAGVAGRSNWGSAGSASSSSCDSITLAEITGGNRCEVRIDPFAASATGVVFWVADPPSTSGGQTITLTNNVWDVAKVGGHSYQLSSSLFGNGGHYFGYLEVTVDSNVIIHLDIEGCPTTDGTGGIATGFSARLTRSWQGHSPNQEVVKRGFTVTSTNVPSGTQRVFANRDLPSGCAIGLDLVSFTLG